MFNQLTEDVLYKTCGLVVENFKIENESESYGAADFSINNRSIKFRKGKITPTKVGQFVTFWKRENNGPIMPYDHRDIFDFLVVSVSNENHFGQFIFPKDVLVDKGIISSQGKGGKRALRIYPPWDKAENSQAKKTQAWQLEYFIEFSEDGLDGDRLRYLLDMA